MDKKTLYPTVNSPDVDVPPSYNEVINPPVENPNYRGEGSSSFQPSAPPSVQGEDEYVRINYNNQHYYQSIPMPTPQHHQAPLERVRYIIKRRDQDERHFPINASLFLLGCLFPPLWFIGCCWKSRNKYEVFWRKINICMSILCCLVFLLAFIVLAIIVVEDDERKKRPTDPDWRIPNVPNLLYSYFSF